MTTINERAFLDMISHSEGTFGKGDNGYNVLVGGKLFDSYADHPRIHVSLPSLHINSTAAGRYQLLERYFDAYSIELGLHDFSPASQDAIALQQIRECKALDDINNGDVKSAIAKCAHIWASLPGAGYGQHENNEDDLISFYQQAGGGVVA